MSVQLKNWDLAGKLFTITLPEQILDSADSIIEQNAEIYKESILGMILDGGAGWTPKSESWANRAGETLFIGETGDFYTNIEDSAMRGVRAKRGDKRVFVGARYDVGHSSGFSMEQIAGILQATPDGSRQLFGPAYERVEAQIRKNFKSVGMMLGV